MKLGIVGLGYVGHAVYRGLRPYFDVRWYDTAEYPFGLTMTPDAGWPVVLRDRAEKMADLMKCDIVFVCVPTPMGKDMGTCDTSIVDTVVRQISGLSLKEVDHDAPHVVIKSTIPPSTCAFLSACNPWLRICFNPEFLTERNYLADFENQDRIILGGPESSTELVAEMYRVVFPIVPIVQVTYEEAEMLKYVTNSLLAIKVSFNNEIYRLCQKLGINYQGVALLANLDHRLGHTHWRVPGPDGHFGFGGSCFPKDMNALLALAEQVGVELPTVKGAWETNITVRPERDWEELKGRAVQDD